jgi:FkbM family methyltransferase
MYSQNDEEQYILEAVGDGPGVFLDIGAFDGKTFSNTAALADRGWSGVLVEPSMNAFTALRRRYADNPRIQLVHAAVGCVRGLVKFWESPDAVSTTSEKHREVWESAAAFQEPYYVAQVTIPDLLNLPSLRSLDLVSIDTEGTSSEIFAHWFTLSIPKPKVFIVEYDFRDEELALLAKGAGFDSAYKSNENLVLVHESCRTRAQV